MESVTRIEAITQKEAVVQIETVEEFAIPINVKIQSLTMNCLESLYLCCGWQLKWLRRIFFCCCAPILSKRFKQLLGARVGGFFVGASIVLMGSAIVSNLKFHLQPRFNLFVLVPLGMIHVGGMVLNLIPTKLLFDDPDNEPIVMRNRMIGAIAFILMFVGVFICMVYSIVALAGANEVTPVNPTPRNPIVGFWKWIQGRWGNNGSGSGSGTSSPSLEDIGTPVSVLVSACFILMGWLCLFLGKMISHELAKSPNNEFTFEDWEE